ncbi:MAG: hypothetical protein UX00_C0002G0054 [Microgenomates group bacterium GW2011_GWB1_45_17]|nr:MAG: hypothetical protein UX00_C0002G0054 [Microgenomates group bacterium GW2011_GWB1_45_17]KKU23793.1 MAG: hypothetical protein UX36_C0003G0093 [Microgenomates group bacterium GW2011_GWC1_46_15]
MTISFKHSLAISTIVVFLSLGVSSALATENASPSPKTRIREKAEERLEKQQEKREEISDRKSVNLEKHCTAIQSGFTNIISRINSRIEKQKAEGRDATIASQHVASAQTALDSAVSLCKQSVAKFDSVPANSWATQKSIIQEARLLAKQAHDQFVAARKSVVAAIRALNTTRKDNKTNTTEGEK